MPIIKCPNCDKEYVIDSNLEWKKVKCSKCENIFILDFSKSVDSKDDIELKEEKNLNSESNLKEELKEEKNIDKKQIEKREEDNKIKPHKMSYILLWSPVILFCIITVISSFFALPVWIFFLFITLLIYLWFNVKYKKEEYIITDRKVIYHYWNLFSDNSVEVNLDKVTQVSSILGFVQYNIFWTWNLRIKTAWSDSSKINLKNILSTMDIYENLQGRMRKNGFHLLKDKLVQTAKPHWLWIIWEMFWKVILNFIIVMYVLWGLITELSSSDIQSASSYAAIPLILFVIITLWIIVINYLDLKRRKYDVYTDSIFYTEWFLTKHFSFLPMESVADTENTQSFFSKIFGLHDVIVSSEWSNNKVLFKNMLDWEQMMKNIKYLKDNIIMWEKDILEWEVKSANSLIGFKDKIEKPLDYDKDYKVQLKMSMLKTLFIPVMIWVISLILWFFVLPSDMKESALWIFPIIIVLSIWWILRVLFTTFIVEESSIEKKFEFLSKKHNSFSVEKITGIIIKESLLDKLLWTCSISFWSIGSSSSIKFSDIKKTPDLEKNILAKVWIKLEKEKKQLPINFSFINYLKSSLWFSIVFLVLLLIALISYVFIPEIGVYLLSYIVIFIVLFIINYIYKIFYYNKSRYIQRISSDFIESISWIIFVNKYYVLFRNVKWIKSIKYPLTDTWTFIFNVAWEQITQNKWQKWISILSNNVKIPFVWNIFDTHNYFDNILNESKIDSNVLSTAKQDIWNSIFWFVIIALIFSWLALLVDIIASISILVFFSIIIWLVVWIIKVKYYNFEKDRVLFGSWIIYKKRHSILL